MTLTPNIGKRFNPQKLFGCIGSEVKELLPLLSGVKVKIKKGKRCKPKKHAGRDHVMQVTASKLCGHKSVYKMTEFKTPKTLKKMRVRFLQKSTHYDNIEHIDIDSVWYTNAQQLHKKRVLGEYIAVMLDGTPDSRKGKKYEAIRKGYVGRKNGKPVTGYCHQIFSVALVGLKKFLYALRCPGDYVAFSNPQEHGDRKLCGLNFDKTIAKYIVRKAHELLPGKRFFWLFDRGFDKFKFWQWIKDIDDDFLTALDSNAECTKKEQRLIDDDAIVLKKTRGFDYHETIVQVEEMTLKAVYVKPHDNTPPYWLLTTRHDLTGLEIKKEYNKRSGEEPLYDYLKNDYNSKPCKQNFAGAQAHTALLCLTHNIVSDLSQQIFHAYHRLPTIVALVVEVAALELLFKPNTKKSEVRTPPPNQCPLGICIQKNSK